METDVMGLRRGVLLQVRKDDVVPQVAMRVAKFCERYAGIVGQLGWRVADDGQGGKGVWLRPLPAGTERFGFERVIRYSRTTYPKIGEWRKIAQAMMEAL